MTSASAVSALLRRKGFSPLGSGTPRTREGIRVSANVVSEVAVSVDYDSTTRAAQDSADAYAVVMAAGYTVTRTSATVFYVTGSVL